MDAGRDAAILRLFVAVTARSLRENPTITIETSIIRNQDSMLSCRLCDLTDPHVHVSENVTAKLHAFKPTHKSIKVNKITGIDWGIPAIRYSGRWYRVALEIVEKAWPLIRSRIKRSVPVEDTEENGEEGQEESD